MHDAKVAYPPVSSCEEWLTARMALLECETEATRIWDSVSAQSHRPVGRNDRLTADRNIHSCPRAFVGRSRQWR